MSDGLIGEFESQAELQKISLGPDEVLIVKFDVDKIGLRHVNWIFEQIIEKLPEYRKNQVVGIPIGIDLDIQQIDYLIDYLKEMKNKI